jgi:glycosyltransferase involved in cell wall biosynthesis
MKIAMVGPAYLFRGGVVRYNEADLMRVTFVLSSLRLSGGVQVVVECANRLAARGHHVSLVAPRDTLDADIGRRLAAKVEVHYSRSSLPTRSGVAAQARLAWSLARAIPPVDRVIATHTPTIVPVLMATRRRSEQRAWLYMDYAEMFERRPIERRLWRYGPRFFSRIGALSEASRQEALRHGAQRVKVIGVGITDSELFVPSSRPVDHHAPTALYVGDARPRKGLAEFLAAAEIAQRSIGDLQLLIVTKEPASIESSVRHTIVLRPDRAALPDLYRQADVFVSSSWSEGFGLPPLEAMACGVPVVMTDSRGVRDFARPDENCVLVPPREVDALAGAIRRVLSDRAFAQSMARAGVSTAQRFQWGGCIDRLERLLAP